MQRRELESLRRTWQLRFDNHSALVQVRRGMDRNKLRCTLRYLSVSWSILLSLILFHVCATLSSSLPLSIFSLSLLSLLSSSLPHSSNPSPSSPGPFLSKE